MSIKLHNVKPGIKRKKKKTIGRGNGSGHGSYSTQGIKGQKARSGVGDLKKLGMRHIVLSTPKLRGFTSIHAKPSILTLDQLEKTYNSGETVDAVGLAEKKLIKNFQVKVKILGTGKISKQLIIKGCQLSAGAKEKIEKAGGKVE